MRNIKFSIFFQKNELDNIELEDMTDIFKDLCSNIIMNNNLNLDFNIISSDSIDMFKDNIYFKNNISEKLYNEIINKVNNSTSYYLSYKELLNYDQYMLIIFYKPLLLKIKSLIKSNDIYDVNIANENEIQDFIQSYIISLLLLNNTLIDQLKYLNNIGYGALSLYSLFDKNTRKLSLDNAKNVQLSYMQDQEYIFNKKYINIKSPISNYEKLYEETIKKFNEEENLDFINSANILLYKIFKFAYNLIKENKLNLNNEYDFVKNAYNHFTNNSTKNTKFFYHDNEKEENNNNNTQIIISYDQL